MKHFVLVCAICFFNCLCGQTHDTITVKEKNTKTLTALPIVYYTPETNFAFGAIGLSSFNFKKDTLGAFKSTVSLGFVYTLNKQVISYLPFYLFLKNGNYRLQGEVSYYKFNYYFYGVGNNNPKDFKEIYDIEYPRLRTTFLKKVVPNFFAGIKYSFDKYSLSNFKANGQLITDSIYGSKGGYLSGIGAAFVYDNRDNNFFPTTGWFAEFNFQNFDKKTGSTFAFNKYLLDVNKYFSKKNNTLAINYHAVFSEDKLPFYQMATMGGIRYMRGFYEGRYRDNNSQILQVEYRKMFKNRFGFTTFGSVGQVNDKLNKFNTQDWCYTYGVGLRYQFNKKQKANLRLDFAIGNNKLLPYFTIGEAF